jgi:hypothetical protein
VLETRFTLKGKIKEYVEKQKEIIKINKKRSLKNEDVSHVEIYLEATEGTCLMVNWLIKR